jgi:tRNA1Val (adenine37-N6)-methyltransferase
MANTYFQFRQFTVHQDKCAMKVTTDSCLFGAWVAEQISGAEGRLLDIGAGTGLLSLMLAQFTNSHIDAVEVEENCYLQLKENVEGSDWSNKINTFHSDILQFMPERPYDFVISNPPFYEKQLQSADATVNLARHANGLNLSFLFQKVRQLIAPDGEFFILIPYYRLEECLKTASHYDFFVEHFAEVRHSSQHKPFRAMFRMKLNSVEKNSETIEVHGLDGKYGSRFKSLLSPFYLKV